MIARFRGNKEDKREALIFRCNLEICCRIYKVEKFFEHGRDPVLTPYKTDQSDFVNVPKEEPTDGDKGSNLQPELKK